MAEKKKLGIFNRTETPEAQQETPTLETQPEPKKRGQKRKRDYKPDEVAPIGVGLTFAEGERLTGMAEELGVNRHELLVWLVRDFMRRWDAGDRPETETKRVLKR